MLSRIESEFLESPEKFAPDYCRVLRHRLKSKTEKIRRDIALLESHGFSVKENCNGVTEFCNGQQSLDQPPFRKLEPGMGIEPIYSGSAGRRLNGSATPALSKRDITVETNKNIIAPFEIVYSRLLLTS